MGRSTSQPLSRELDIFFVNGINEFDDKNIGFHPHEMGSHEGVMSCFSRIMWPMVKNIELRRQEGSRKTNNYIIAVIR